MAYISKYLKAHSVSLQTKAAVWYLICNFLQKGISLISVPLYTRLLTTDQYGAYQVFCSWVEIFEIITTLRLSWGEYPVGLVKFTEDAPALCADVRHTGYWFLEWPQQSRVPLPCGSGCNAGEQFPNSCPWAGFYTID